MSISRLIAIFLSVSSISLSCWSAQSLAAESVNPVCPPPNPEGPGMFSGSPERPMSEIHGHLARLEGMGTPIRFTDLMERKVELQSVHYKGIVSGPYVIPIGGNIGSAKIDGKNVTLQTGDLSAGCIVIQDVGEVLVLFENSLGGGGATLVLTAEQLKMLPN